MMWLPRRDTTVSGELAYGCAPAPLALLAHSICLAMRLKCGSDLGER